MKKANRKTIYERDVNMREKEKTFN